MQDRSTLTERLNETTSVSFLPDEGVIDNIRARLAEIDRGVIVAGPGYGPDIDGIRKLGQLLDYPIFADPLSGIRYGPTRGATVLGGYDAYLDPAITEDWPSPEMVIRFGGRPTSVTLREYLQTHEGTHVMVDPGGEYLDPEFSTTTVVPSTPGTFSETVRKDLDARTTPSTWISRFSSCEERYWDLVTRPETSLPVEGRIAHRTIADAPDNATVFVSNSMPIRDVDRFGKPMERFLTVLGNRGVSGIDGIVSSALGAGAATDDPVVLLVGDLAFYHDMNGLLAIERCDLDVTIIVIHNDGGGIFHSLPISSVEPPFTEQFLTPHDLDFSPVADLYGLEYTETTVESFPDAYAQMQERRGGRLIVLPVDGRDNKRERDRFQREVRNAFR